jgi:hypothetical protein
MPPDTVRRLVRMKAKAGGFTEAVAIPQAVLQELKAKLAARRTSDGRT